MTIHLTMPYKQIDAAKLRRELRAHVRIIFLDGSVAQKDADGRWYSLLGTAGQPGEAAEFVAEINSERENRYGRPRE